MATPSLHYICSESLLKDSNVMIFSGITIWSYFDAVRADGGSVRVAALANALAVVQFAMLLTFAGCARESAAGVKLAGVTVGGCGA